jgi:prepilin-type N-terminal cleavage/methylation domain-containing protein
MNRFKQASIVRGRAAPVLARTQGFSLVELMVALALSIFLLGGLILTYVSGRAAATDAENLSRLQENMRFVSDHLLRDIRNAGFRDQLTLTFGQYEDIGRAYAESDGNSLTIRYAGRSHCAQSREAFNQFTELTLVENTFFVQNGRLRCTGLARGNQNTTDMVNGVAAVSFDFQRPDGAVPANPLVCNFDTDVDLETACTGVGITLTFEGIRPGDQREAVLFASFRNVLVDRIYGRGGS